MRSGPDAWGKRKETDEYEVKRSQPRTFQYINIGGDGRRYFCLQQNPLIFAWLLYFKKDTLNLIFSPWFKHPFQPWSFGFCRDCCLLLLSNLKTLIFFTWRRRNLRTIDTVVELPLYGQICIPVHKGYKIFDLRRGVVAKVFDPDVNSSSILSEIERLKKVSPIDFAPSLKRWNIEERWYEEEYVSSTFNESSHKLLDSAIFLKRFYHEIVPRLVSLMLWQKPMTNNSIEYIKEIMEIIEVSGLSRRESTVREFNKIQSFLDSVLRRLRVEGNCDVQLVFTHGDFCPANMLKTRHGIRIIDWESAKYRSALFDFYSYFFYRPVYMKIPGAQLVSEINEALPFVISSLAKKTPTISNSLRQFGKVYLWIYFIEEICKGVEREMTDRNLNIVEDILHYIEAFNRYEETLAGNTD